MTFVSGVWRGYSWMEEYPGMFDCMLSHLLLHLQLKGLFCYL